MNLKKTIAAVVALTSTSVFAGFHGYEPVVAAQKNTEDFQQLLNRNYNEMFSQHDYFNRIRVSGLLKGYALVSSVNPKIGRFYDDDVSSDLFLSRANVYVDAKVNDWIDAHVAISFLPAQYAGVKRRDDEISYRKFDIVDEAILTMKDFSQYPTYLRFGIGYTRYGRYERNNLPMTFTQVLTQTQAALVELGFIDSASGFSGAVYVFHGVDKSSSTTPNINNFGVQLGYCFGEDNWSVDVTADYMFNIAGAVNALGDATTESYDRVVGGAHVGVNGYFNEFDGTVQFTTAVRKFRDSSVVSTGKRPAAALIDLGYNFPLAGYESRLGISYQHSFDARLEGTTFVAPIEAITEAGDQSAALGLPKNRVQGDLTVEVCKNTTLGFHLIWDNPYSDKDEVRAKSATTGLLSLTAKIA